MRKGPEKQFWEWLDAATAGLWDVQRHEDRYSVGIPDLSYGARGVNGWIELKAYREWPTRPLPHFTGKQANWLYNRGDRGGHCFVLVRVKSTIMIFDWTQVHDLRHKIVGGYDLCYHAIKVWDKAFDRKEFLEIITEENK